MRKLCVGGGGGGGGTVRDYWRNLAFAMNEISGVFRTER